MYRGSYSKRYAQPSSSWSVDASRILKCKVMISFRKNEAHIRRSKNLFTLQGCSGRPPPWPPTAQLAP